jgi:glycerophosphoryl diester phosphodiesterase
MLRLAHRGHHRRARENTTAALRAAARIPGCDGVEFDVRASADGVPILLHDPSLRRVFGRRDHAAELTAAELSAIGVPTLADALAVLPPTVFLDVELKEDVVDATIEVLREARGDPPAAVVVSSFDTTVLRRLRTLVPAWPKWLNAIDLGRETVTKARRIECTGIAAEWRSIDERAMRRAGDADLVVAGWTVTRRATAERLGELGVLAICVEGAALTAD